MTIRLIIYEMPNLLQMSKMYIEKFKISKIVLTGGEVLEDLNDNETNSKQLKII